MEKKRSIRGICLLIAMTAMTIWFAASVSAQSECFYDANGKVIVNKYGYKAGEEYYRIDSTGAATLVPQAQGLAGSWLDKNCKAGQTNLKKLQKGFRWSARLRYTNIRTKVPAGQTAEEYFGMYGFLNKRGDCNVQAATFYWMAKALGYQPKMIRGYVPRAYNAAKKKYSRFGAHAWCEIRIGGRKYAFDPNLAGTSEKNKRDARGRKVNINTGWKFKYGAKSTPIYFNSTKKKQYK